MEARRPRVIVTTPEPVWVLDNYRVRTWYYRAAPEVGSKVMYLEDGRSTRISRVSWNRIYFVNSTSMRRPYSGARLVGWVLPRLQMMTRTPNLDQTTPHGSPRWIGARIRMSRKSDGAPNTRTPVFARRRSVLMPDRTTLYV